MVSSQKELVFVKIGGSFVTYKDKPFSINYAALDSLVKILKSVVDKVAIVLGHGGGSFAHPVVEAFHGSSDKVRTIVYCQKATRSLNKIILDYLIDNDIPVVQLQTSAIITIDGGVEHVNVLPIKIALNNKLIPVVYGECIHSSRDVYQVYSTEKIFLKLIDHGLMPNRIVYLENVAGVYERDPMKYSDTKLLREINRRNIGFLRKCLGKSHGIDVTGGMLSKIMLSLEIARKYKIPSIVVSGFNIEDSVKAITTGVPRTGTVIYW